MGSSINTRILAIKFELLIDVKNQLIIDKVSEDLRRTYNGLLDLCKRDYEVKKKIEEGKEVNDGEIFMDLMSGYNIRDYLIKTRKGTEYEKYYSSIVKNTALRLKTSFKNFFSGRSGYPKFKPYNRQWFSLFYDEPSKIPTIEKNGKVLIKLGKDKDGNSLNFHAKIKDYFVKEKSNIRNVRITKKLSNGRYYISLTIEVPDRVIKECKKSKKFISIDPNHKNFFCSIDSDGVSMEVKKLNIAKALDKEIDILKSKISNKNKYSREWNKLDKKLKKVYHKRDEQIKNSLYELAHYITKRYNVVIIGDYTPSINVAKYRNQRRSMLNQTFIGEFRKVLKHVCWKYGTEYIMVDESYTTQTCCINGKRVKRTVDEREWVVDGRKVLRDINSAVKIARKAGEKFNLDTNLINLSSIDVDVELAFNKKLNTHYHYKKEDENSNDDVNICLARTIEKDNILDGELQGVSVIKQKHFYINNW